MEKDKGLSNEHAFNQNEKELCRAYMQQFVLDPDLFADKSAYQPYVYDQTKCDAYFDRQINLGRIHLAILLHDEPIGELVLKSIDYDHKHCTMGISMKNDQFKNKGYGTQAEILALEYAFRTLGMKTVFADALLNNKRSQHVLKKAGFQETHRDHAFVFYKCDQSSWNETI